MRALITGCSRGIGEALARKFRQEGWEVCATTRKPLAAGDAFAMPLDVCDQNSVDHALQKISERWDSLDLLINNAAIFPGEGDEKLEDLDLNWFGEAVDCNVVGVAR